MEPILLESLTTFRGDSLWLAQKKWYKWEYELTDGAFVYGRIYNKGWKQSTILETANGSFKICSSFSGKHTVKTADDVELGSTCQKLFDRRVTLTMNDGFKASYYNPSVWKSIYLWEDEAGHELIQIKFNAFAKKRVEISFTRQPSQIPHFSILLLLAMKFYMAQMAAAATM